MNSKSKDVQARLEKVGVIKVSMTDAKFLLFSNNTKAYQNRFNAFCKNVITQGYLFEIIEALLSAKATECLTKPDAELNFLKGQVNSLLELKQIINEQASALNNKVADEDKQ